MPQNMFKSPTRLVSKLKLKTLATREWGAITPAKALCLILALALGLLVAPGFGASSALAGGPTRVSGGGEAVAAAFVTYVGHDGVNRNVRSINTIGNRFTFGFNATKDAEGNVRGQMQLVDHDIVFDGKKGLVIHSDVTGLRPHPRHRAPVGAPLDLVSFRMASSTTSVMVNGESRPGWQIRNSPTFDGGEPGADKDTVCLELFNAAGDRILQWSAFLSSGNVQIQQ